MTTMTTTQDRVRGVLFGQAVGDSLGAQVEFSSVLSIRGRFPDGVREMTGGGPHGLSPGMVTDDTELALSLARSLVMNDDYMDDDVAAAYVAWKHSHPFDIGGTTANALGGGFDHGQPLAPQLRQRAAQLAASQANGSLMRISPLGIFGINGGVDDGAAADLAALDSTLTHASIVCQQACSAYVVAMRCLIRNNEDRQDRALAAYHKARNRTTDESVRRTLTASRLETLPSVDGGHQGWVLFALQIAFHQMFYAKSFEEGLVQVVGFGGDADTNGCIAGALMGAVFGASEIPERWKNTVLGCKTIRPPQYHCGDLIRLADALAACGSAVPSQCDSARSAKKVKVTAKKYSK